eukprot:scaffold278724_cov18-Tisochrysis_lutea.AAC.2
MPRLALLLTKRHSARKKCSALQDTRATLESHFGEPVRQDSTLHTREREGQNTIFAACILMKQLMHDGKSKCPIDFAELRMQATSKRCMLCRHKLLLPKRHRQRCLKGCTASGCCTIQGCSS